MKLAVIGLAVLLLSAGLTTRAQSQNSQTVAIRAGHLFDSKSGKMLDNQVVLVDGEKITAVGSADQVQIPSGAQVRYRTGHAKTRRCPAIIMANKRA